MPGGSRSRRSPSLWMTREAARGSLTGPAERRRGLEAGAAAITGRMRGVRVGSSTAVVTTHSFHRPDTVRAGSRSAAPLGRR